MFDIVMLTIPSVTVFWRKISKDLQRSIATVEKREPWVWHQNEMPELYERLAEILPELAGTNAGERSEELAERLVNLLGKASFGFSVAALSYLEALYRHERTQIRWCELCIDWIARHGGNPSQPYAGVMSKRLKLIINTRTSQTLLESFTTLYDDSEEEMR